MLYHAPGVRHKCSIISDNCAILPKILPPIAEEETAQGNDTVGIGPSLGYAIGQADSKSYPYLATEIRYYSIGVNDQLVSGTDIVVGGGLIIPAREHLGIVVEVGYHIMNLKRDNWKESKSGNIISIGIGVAGLLF